MIHKIIKGSYFKGALRYVLDPNKGLLIGGTFGSHQSPSEIAHEMREVAGDRLRKPVFHAVLSLRPGESLSNEQWNEAAQRYLSALGYDDAPYVLVRHTNREHDHVHIIASRARYDGTVVSDRQDRFKGLAAVRELSREYGLSLGASSSPRSLLAAEVRALVRGAAEGRPSFATFLGRLESAGVRVTAHVPPGRKRIQGLSFGLDGTTFKASQLGREISWSGLQKLGVQFDPDKDLPLALARSSRQARHDEGSAWTPEAIRDLSRRLRTLRTGTRAGGTASRDLLRHGSQAFRLSSHVARFLEGNFRPTDAARRTAKTLAAGDHLSLALAFLGAFRSPGAAALFLLRIAQRAPATPTREIPADPAVLFLRQLAHAAAGDRPGFDVFRDRLAEAGVHLAPGAFVLPDRVVSGRAIGLDAVQLEKLGVQNHENDLETLIARFVAAIEIAETTAQTLQAATAPLTRVSARIEALGPPLTQHHAQLEELAQRLPALTAELTSAAFHLRGSLKPPIARIWATASALVLATSLLLLGVLTALRPQWCLTEPLQDQLRMGHLLAERFSSLPEDRQWEFSSLLQELSSPTSSRSSSKLSGQEVSRSGSVRPNGR